MKLDLFSPNPSNPRFITENDFTSLLHSVLLFPEMLEARGVVFIEQDGVNVVIGSNQRFRAIGTICAMPEKELSDLIKLQVKRNKKIKEKDERIKRLFYLWSEIGKKGEIPDTWTRNVTEWTEEQIEEFVIKDNTHLGGWDMDILANNFDFELLREWAVPGLPSKELDGNFDDFFNTEPDQNEKHRPEIFRFTLEFLNEEQFKMVFNYFADQELPNTDVLIKLIEDDCSRTTEH